MTNTALNGLRVLDLSRFIAGPLCAQLLGDLGAEVIKVERPGGEDTRFIEPSSNGKSIYVAQYHRNKRAMTLDPRTDEGRTVLRELTDWAEVIVENFRPGTLAKMGIEHDDLLSKRPNLIIVSISGFGQEGPNAERPLFDSIAQAMTGLMRRNGTPESGPVLTHMFPGDTITGLYATIGTLAAVQHRDRTGKGQVIDLALFDSLFASMGPLAAACELEGFAPELMGNRDLFNAPATVFDTSDGQVYIHAGTQAFWKRMCEEVLDRPELVTTPPYSSISGRMEVIDEVENLVQHWSATVTCDEAERILGAIGIPCGKVAGPQDVLDSEQVEARGLLMRGTDVQGDPFVSLANPLHMSETPPRARTQAPPIVGQDTEWVLREVLGKNGDEVRRLLESSALG